MNIHKNARTTPHIRALIVDLRGSGVAVSVIAERFGISPRTVYKWVRRYREAGRAGLLDRSSAPATVANALPGPWIDMAVKLRRELRLSGQEIAEHLQLARSTVARWLKRFGLGRLANLDPKPPVTRYQRERPGEMVHLDIKKLGRFNRVGHRITGDRTRQSNQRQNGTAPGWEFVHVCIDDATRLAYVEVLDDEKKWTAAGFLLRATRWFKQRGVHIERVMTDNGSCYRSGVFTKTCSRIGARHVKTRPYSPQTNGKAERFIQILLREWAYAIPYSSSLNRKADLPRWLDWYNQNRPHSALNRQSPASALNNLVRNHI